MSDGISYTWGETHAGAKFSVKVQFPEGHQLHTSHSHAELLNIVATAGSEFRQFIETETSIANGEAVGDWVCNAITRMGTPESPAEFCETEVHHPFDHCPLHGGEQPW